MGAIDEGKVVCIIAGQCWRPPRHSHCQRCIFSARLKLEFCSRELFILLPQADSPAGQQFMNYGLQASGCVKTSYLHQSRHHWYTSILLRMEDSLLPLRHAPSGARCVQGANAGLTA